VTQLRATCRPIILIAALAALAALPAAAAATQGEFADAPTSPEFTGAGSEPIDLIAANFTGDTGEDLAIADDTGFVIALVATGSGDFTQATGSPFGSGILSTPQSITGGQLSSDSNFDLAVGNATGTSVSIFLGNGTGFDHAASSPEPAGSNPSDVAVGNFNGDANADLAVTNRGSDDVTILLGSASGDFTAAVTSPEPAGDGAESIAVGAFNADAHQDLAIANANADNIAILLGDGAGNFTASAGSPEVTGGAADVAVGTFDGDADQDLAVTNGDTGVTVLLGDGAGDFTAAPTSPEPAGTNPRALAVTELSGDSEDDIAVVNASSENLTVLLGDGDGDFSEPPTSPQALASTPTAIAAGSLGGDAATDLAVSNFGSTVSILLNNPPSFERTLSIRYKQAKREFSGKVKADGAGCVEGDSVTLLKKRDGDDKVLGDDESAASGKYKVQKRGRPGRYYADVEQSTDLGALCYADRSPTLTVP
jgi:hypothetical protein